MEGRKGSAKFRKLVGRMAMECLCSGEQLKRADETIRSSDSTITKDYSASGYSSRNGEIEQYLDNGNIEEAELSLREGVCLNYEEARALLGRLEYQRGHVEAALRVFDGIDISALVPKMKISIARKADRRRTHLQWDSPPMPLHAVSLLMEAIYLKARALHDLGKFKEATRECRMILDIVEAAVPEGLPSGFGKGCKLNEIICKAVELLPELWKLGGFSLEALASYRRCLLNNWNLDGETIVRIQKKFAVFLLYSGCEARPPNLHSQLDGSFVPRNNMEEAILLLMILLRKFNLKRIESDPSVMHHLTFALSMSGQLNPLAEQFEISLPGVLDKNEWLYNVALCYLAEEDDLSALNLLKRILKSGEDSDHLKELLLASKACVEMSAHTEGASYARRAIANMQAGCEQMAGVADLLLGVSLSNQARSAISDTDRASWQCEALEMLGNAEKKMHGKDSRVMYSLSLENAEQRKLDAASFYAKKLVKLEAGSELRSWLLLARILSAQKQFADAETIVNAALDQTGKWSQGYLLRTKARTQAAQGQFRDAVVTYTQLLAIIQLRTKSFSAGFYLVKGNKDERSLEIETWYDLALLYLGMSQWRDAEVCVSKIRAISPYSALTWHVTGKIYEVKGHTKEALGAFFRALDLDPKHVPSLISTAIVLQQLGDRPLPSVRCFLTDALQLDRTNHVAWFNLGLLYKEEGGRSAAEAAECFQAAALLEETAPVEPFR
ncbi:protein NPGR2-like [Phragmites australis]|uniref:protein NPGR2-like n=1 Tax=Phragmites australis TaxID=29695 RepID=UPI002D785BE1|nr:protein NPGR2-like [Phragmites australis]XP_062205143.1 protein NPGR2-like [Phragmites australis]XP_062205145.1 protein NPGR2-like [Phragmites australis]XP_062205146.1 protein NPGR2-like [Phragmites australis]XP_062205147.1 protein NPGR2-like [Phragmites australis]